MIVAEAVNVEFVDVVAGAVNDELGDVLVPEGEGEAADVTAAGVGEVEAFVVAVGIIGGC